MRIRNKLITVQLVMAITLMLSILFFSLHINKMINIKNTGIILHHLSSDITRIENANKVILTKRISLSETGEEMDIRYNSIKENMLLIKNSPFLKSAHLRQSNKDINTSLISVNSKSFGNFTKNLIPYIDTDIDDLVKRYGIKGTFEIMVKKSESDSIVNDYNSMNTMFQKYLTDFSSFNKLWTSLSETYIKELEKTRINSWISTIMLLIFLVIVSFILNYRITNKITLNLNTLNNSVEQMTLGDFSIKLEIDVGDEFGDLARHFNNFISDLWKKLDAMNVIMKDIGHAMNEDLDQKKIQGNILNNISNHIIADSSALFSLKDDMLHLTSSKGHFPPFFPIEEDLSTDRPAAARYLENNPISIDTPIVNECVSQKKAIIVKECFNDPAFPQCRNKDSALYIRSLMMVPLINGGELIGIFVTLRTTMKRAFTDLDFSNFSSFGDYAALTIDTLGKYNELLEKFEMQKEIGVAADIQKSLVPTVMPRIKGISSGAFTLAAKGVSGDYYDFFQMNKTTIGATVCDVAGKGVPASLVMVMIRTILRLVASPKRGAAETLTLLNKSISGKIDIDRYATMGYFKIDLKNMKLNFSNAAHHPIQIYRQKSKKFYAIDTFIVMLMQTIF
ncbi:MAG: hypothetical protein B6229_07285 [Spirochaetaceae bacterium 4572_7]|nr:MAG: hypothetical protein B6229_07285 [Spirochaetaceae bacterium 4572_7]